VRIVRDKWNINNKNPFSEEKQYLIHVIRHENRRDSRDLTKQE
jgi:hypothetical protein